jgi:hypothetical protein
MAESDAMWKLYGGAEASVVIQTTYQKLRDALPGSIDLGEIKYIDYQNGLFGSNGTFERVWHKRKAYEHEREVRALIWKPAMEHTGQVKFITKGEGMLVEVDVNDLVTSVRVCPHSSIALQNKVQSMIRERGFSFDVSPSDLMAAPTF